MLHINPVARTYAEALVAIGTERQQTAVLQGELTAFCDLLSEIPQLRVFLESPGIPTDAKTHVVDSVFELDLTEMFRNFLCILIRKGRFYLLPRIRDAVLALADEAEGRVRATVTSAITLSEERITRLAAILSEHLGKQVVLKAQVDPQLLGGLVVSYGDTRMDYSVRSALATVRARLQSKGGVL